MREPKFPFIPPESVRTRLDAELKARVEAAKAERGRPSAEAKWDQLLQKKYNERWAGVELKKGISSILLTPEQVKDVLDRLDMNTIPKDGDYLLVGGAKFKVWDNGAKCSLAGYHHSNDDLVEVVKRIRNRQTLRPDVA